MTRDLWPAVTERLSRIGARIGTWNDRNGRHDRRADATLRWRIIDRIAGTLYVLPEKPHLRYLRWLDYWRCECGRLNREDEAFCYRCGAGDPADA